MIRAAFALSAAAALAGAAPVEPAAVRVVLSSYSYAPNPIRLEAGRETRLQLVNTSGKGHNFSAPEFFEAAQIAEESRNRVRRGTVEVPEGETVTVLLVPAKGDYPLRCTHFAHTMLGMKGRIEVR